MDGVVDVTTTAVAPGAIVCPISVDWAQYGAAETALHPTQPHVIVSLQSWNSTVEVNACAVAVRAAVTAMLRPVAHVLQLAFRPDIEATTRRHPKNAIAHCPNVWQLAVCPVTLHAIAAEEVPPTQVQNAL